MIESRHSQALGHMAVGPLLIRMAVPTSLAMLVQASYSLVDTIFVGKGVGPQGIAALALYFPLQRVVRGLNSLLAVGGASLVSRSLGSGDPETAERTIGSVLAAALLLGALVVTTGLLAIEWLLTGLGASGELRTITRDFMSIALLEIPFFLINGASILMIRAEGRARMAMAAMIVGTAINIGLDPLFIFVFGWGIQGAAAATVIGRATATVLVLIHFWTRRSGLRLRRHNLIPRTALVGRVAGIGVSSAVWTMSQAVLFAINNHMLEGYGGVIYLSAFGVTWRLLMFLGLPVAGIFQGFRPICGYNYGAGNYSRVKKALSLSIAASAIYLLLPFGAMRFFSRSLIHLFTSDPALLNVGADYMRVFSWLIPTFSATVVGTAFYQSLGKAGKALMMNLLQPLTAVPILLIAGPLWGLRGVIMAFPAAFLLYAVLAALIVWQGARRHLDPKTKQSEEIA